MRPDTTLEGLGKLKPSFVAMGQAGFDAVALRKYPQIEAVEHVHTGGNSSGIVDGSAAVLLGNAEFGRKIGKKPRARIKAFVSMGSEPTIMLSAPAPTTQKLLKRCGMAVKDIDLFEINEAFAAVVMRYMRLLDIDPGKVNVNGGAIALGHPLGCSGAKLMATLVNELERTGGRYGLQTMCEGGGLANATIIERLG
jgi:acetyl-CoA C-acetyltransferase